MRAQVLALATALMAAGCSATVYKEEAAAVGIGATDLGTTLDGYSAAIRATQAQTAAADRMREFYLGDPVEYGHDCWRGANQAYAGYLNALSAAGPSIEPAETAALDTAFAAMRQVKPCVVAEPTAAATPAPRPAAAPTDPAEIVAAQAAAEGRLQAAVNQAWQDHLAAPAPATPQGNVGMSDFTRELSAYGAALTAIASAKSTEDVRKAITEAGAGLNALAKAAGETEVADPLANLAMELVTLQVEEAQRRAMKGAVLAFEAAWPRIAPALTQAARVQHGALIWEQSRLSWTTAATAQYYVNQPALLGSPFERLQVYNSLNGEVVSAASALRTSTRTDPATAIDAFTVAHHDLALAVMDDGRLVGSFTASLRGLNEKVTALDGALDKRAAREAAE